MSENFDLTTSVPLSINELLINLGIGIVLSIILRWHFRQFGSTLSNREEFSQVCPFILLTTILIITVVKSSLALSLGLVGALSIVRFRTPVKEPEELAYLFIAIAMGLGLGANQTLPTLVAGLVILAVMAVFKWTRPVAKSQNLFLSIDMGNGLGGQDRALEKLNALIGKHVVVSDLRRLDARADSLEATYFIDIDSSEKLTRLIDDLHGAFSGIGVTFIDQNQMPVI